MKKISIVVPIYNVEKYLEECVNSILKQDYKDYEIILVDDGSTDLSGKIADKYQENNANVRAFHKKNGGLSDARNYGIMKSEGEYILFVDGDDFIKENSLINIVTCIEHNDNPDVVFLSIYKWINGNIIPMNEGISNELIDKKEKIVLLNNIARLNKFPGSACSKAIKRQVIIDNEIFFEKGLLSEDIDWVTRVLQVATSFSFCNEEYYYYRQKRQGSITNQNTSKNVNDLMKTIIKLSDKEPKSEEQIAINGYMAYEYCINIANYMLLKKSEREKVKYRMFEYFWIMQYGKSKKLKFVYKLSKIFGEKNTAKLMACYLKYRKA